MNERAQTHVQSDCPTHEVLASIRRANRVYVATLVAPGQRTSYILIPKTQARELMKHHETAFIRNENGNLFIGPASRIVEEKEAAT